MTKKDCIIDVGTAFTVEWYFDEKGYSQAYEYFLQTSNDQKRKFLLLVKKMVAFGKILDITKYRNEGDGFTPSSPSLTGICPSSSRVRKSSSRMLFTRTRTKCQRVKRNGQ